MMPRKFFEVGERLARLSDLGRALIYTDGSKEAVFEHDE